MDLELRQIIVQILGFILMLWVLKKFGWKPLLDHLAERQERIKSEFDEIESRKKEVDTLISEYKTKLDRIEEEARIKLKEAVADGQTIALEINARAQQSLRDAQVKIQSNIQMEIAKASSELKDRMVDMVIITTEKLLKKTLDKSDHKELIEEMIDEAKLK
jgi:F-type H+-transporting ATPase subunit b